MDEGCIRTEGEALVLKFCVLVSQRSAWWEARLFLPRAPLSGMIPQYLVCIVRFGEVIRRFSNQFLVTLSV